MNKRLIYGLWAVLVIVYVISVFIIQPDLPTLRRFNITALQLRLLSLTIVIPIFTLWLAAIYGMVKVWDYANKIKGTPDGEGFKYLAYGLASFGFGQATASVVGRLLSYLVSVNAIPYTSMTIINTHLTIIVQLISFGLLLIGASRLVKSVKKIQFSPVRSFGTGIALAIISSLYSLATLANPLRSVSVGALPSTYAIPDWLIVTTIILPYIFAWALGFYTVLFLRTYYKSIGGTIYKKSLARMNFGFLAIILSSITLQFATSAIQAIFGWGLGGLLSVLYTLIIIIAIGYIYVAMGAKKLAKLEDVV